MAKLKFLLIGFSVAVITIMYTPLIQFLAKPLIVKDQLAACDAIVVISGGWKGEGELGISTMERYKYGISLYQKGYGKYLIFSGGNMRGNPSEAAEMAKMAVDDGFPEQAVLVDRYSESTWENATFVKKILLEEKLSSVILVTSPYHSLRAKTMFMDREITVRSAPVPDSEFFKASGFEQFRMAKLVLLEYVKLLLYHLHIK